MQISANTQVKVIEGHYTGHFKAVVHKPENVFVMRDIAAAGYVAGGNTLFFGAEAGQKEFRSGTAVRQLTERLTFAESDNGKYHSMMAFPVSNQAYETGMYDTAISVTSRLLPWEVTHGNSSAHTYFPGGNAMFEMYRKMLQLDSIHYGEDVRATESMEFISQGSTNNALCFPGPFRRYSPLSRSRFELIPGQGHWGPDALPGDARWRRGESVSMKSSRDAMVSLEAVASAQFAFQNRA